MLNRFCEKFLTLFRASATIRWQYFQSACLFLKLIRKRDFRLPFRLVNHIALWFEVVHGPAFQSLICFYGGIRCNHLHK